MAESSEKLTPMFAQYQSIKKNYPDALLFFRMGDFYELFFEDAETASRVLQITLTARTKGANAVPMCGVPWHAAQSYVAQLIDRGYNVAICDQIEDPRAAKGIVQRAVTSVITPGTVLDEGCLDAKNHNYLGAVFCGLNDSCAFAWADVSTGQWTGIEFRRQADLWQWVRKLGPAELLVMDGQAPPQGFNSEGIRIVRQPAVTFELKRGTERILAAQGVRDLSALDLADKPSLTRACSAVLAYLDQTQIGKTSQLMPFAPLDMGKRLLLDEFTERNLEIFTRLNGRKGKGTLIHLLDETVTPMGARLLEDMLHHPFRDKKLILRIQDCVVFFASRSDVRSSLRSALAEVLDLERIIMRISLGRAGPRDFASLGQSLAALPAIVAALEHQTDRPAAMVALLNEMDLLQDLARLLTFALADSVPVGIQDGGIFRKGFNAELDQLMDLQDHGEQMLNDLLAREQEQYNLPKLRYGFNKVFGYYFELSRSVGRDKVPGHFVPRQTLAGGERYTTEELKALEEKILNAGERRRDLEKEMFHNLQEHVAAQKDRIVQTADMLGHLDYWQSLGEVGRREGWCAPVLSEQSALRIREGRHPVVEAILGRANFVPNDFYMDEGRRVCLLTGPNMAGKSTVLRQVALICLLAQIGSLVPATEAELGIVDRLFSRVGASDNLAQGQSTFMVEMMETARILRQATRRSLIILDEIGRGTSTWDGMSIAWSVVEDLAARCQGQLRTIFATHYHELTALEGRVPGLFTMNIAVGAYDSKEILFLHRLVPGPSDKSYGVEVARLAGIPYPVVQRAREILKTLEQSRPGATETLPLPGVNVRRRKDAVAAVIQELAATSPEALDASAALGLVQKWHGMING